jgi:hypothetical protein
MLMGVATALNFCRGGELGQCLAHYIMGSAFIAYAVLLVIMLNFGGDWLQRMGCSQEILDSTVIMIWVSPGYWIRIELMVGYHKYVYDAPRGTLVE